MKDNLLLQNMNALIKDSQSIVLTGHQSPDGDCLGSIIGLGLSLQKLNKQVTMIIDDTLPSHLKYIPGIESVIFNNSPEFSKIIDSAKEYEQVRIDNENNNFDLFIMLDIGDIPRLGNTSTLLNTSKKSLCFDHHATNGEHCDYNFVQTDASSTCEIVANFLLNYNYPMFYQNATALYTGLITDSNRFLYNTARQNAMRTAANLLDNEADANLVYLNEYQLLNRDLLSFQGYAVENAQYLFDERVAIFCITTELLKKYNLEMSDAETVVDVLKNLVGVEVAIIIKEKQDDIQKISLRSKSYFNVSEIAQQFGGGGHVMAAGCTIEGTTSEAFDKIKDKMEQVVWDK